VKLPIQLPFHLPRPHRRIPPIAYAAFIVVTFALAGFFSASSVHTATIDRLVTFHDRGKNHVILTHATTVRSALKDADITVDLEDIVEPAIDSELLSTDSAVIIYRSRPVLVTDGALKLKVITAAQSPSELAAVANVAPIQISDKATLAKGDFIADGAITKLTIERAVITPKTAPEIFHPGPNALSKSKGAQLYTDANGVTHRETYYDLPMNAVMGACGGGGYTIRYDGAKIDKDGYLLVAANLHNYPRCSIVETSMGPGKVYDTGGFALRYPHGFDLATDWSNANGN
jgi:hypothetical protein